VKVKGDLKYLTRWAFVFMVTAVVLMLAGWYFSVHTSSPFAIFP